MHIDLDYEASEAGEKGIHCGLEGVAKDLNSIDFDSDGVSFDLRHLGQRPRVEAPQEAEYAEMRQIGLEGREFVALLLFE